MSRLLATAPALEGITGLALALDPPRVVRLLFGAEPSGAGLAMSRVAGIALLALTLACWPARGGIAGRAPALRAMTAYNALATLYLLSLGVGAEWVGPLLWPAVAAHAGLSIWCLALILRPGEREPVGASS